MQADKYTAEELKEKLKDFPIDPNNYCGHYSPNGFYIRKIGTTEEYAEAIDLLPCIYEYEETDKPLPVTEPREQQEPAEQQPITER